MFIELLRRTVARTGGTLREVCTRTTRLSQFCHGCGQYMPKPLWQRWHDCPCGIGPIQRDLSSADLSAYLDLPNETLALVDRYLTTGEGPLMLLKTVAELLTRTQTYRSDFWSISDV